MVQVSVLAAIIELLIIDTKPSIVSALCNALRTGTPAVQTNAAEALGQISPKLVTSEVEETLLKSLTTTSDTGKYVRYGSAKALGRLLQAGAITKSKDLMEDGVLGTIGRKTVLTTTD